MFRRRKQTTSGRDKLVEEFIKAYPVAKSNASRTVFDFPVSTSTGVVALQMTLPVGFPQSRPIVVSRTQIRHHLFDTTMRVVGSASLQTWTEHSSLSKTVESIITDLQRNVPIFLRPMPARSPITYVTPTPPSPVAQPPRPPRSPVARPMNRPPPQRKPAPSVGPVWTPPHIDTKFDILDSFNTEELKKVVESEEHVTGLIDSLGCFAEGDKKKKELYESVTKLTDSNLGEKPKFEELQRTIADLRKEEFKTRSTLQQLLETQRDILKKFGGPALRKQLMEAITKADEKSEDVLQQFVDEESEIDAFIKDYKNIRTLYHTRVAKMERLTYGGESRASQ
ncbi:hypothetical protein AAMO2058_000315300 [Amorphochlora amoebiformis]